MHFGRVEQDKDLDLTLPPLSERSQRFLQLGHQGKGSIFIGAPIWAEKLWVGSLYPESARPSDFLRHYAEHYPCVEYNGSFYRLPSLDQVKAWVRMVPEHFRFCAKVPQDISHKLGGVWDPKLLAEVFQVLETFGEHAGLSFLQLPDHFAPKDAAALLPFFKAWSQHWPLAIEFRHPSWFTERKLLDPLINELYRHKMSVVITDTPGRRDVVHSSLCHTQVMVRFLGTFPSARDDERLKAWAERLEAWAEAGLESLYFFVHQARHPGIPPTVDRMRRLIWDKAPQRLVPSSV